MAIVKNNYVKRGSDQRDRVKASLRYIAYRPGKDNKRMYRELFGHDGVMEKEQAYRMFDAAQKGTNFFRLVISTDPKREDTYKDLQMRAIAMKTIQHLEEKLHLEGKIQFVAAIHNDHTNIRHIHAIVLVPKKLSKEEFKVFQDLKHAATAEALRQRQQLDQVREAQRERSATYLIYDKDDFVQSSPPPSIMACVECGAIQPAEVLSRTLYRCIGCGNIQSRSQYAGASGREAGPQLSL
jgi:hypothetical protein